MSDNTFNSNWLPPSTPQQRDIASMGNTINYIVQREMGPFAASPYRNDVLRTGQYMDKVWQGQQLNNKGM